ncbi:MAG: hypothetical protein AAF658_17900, partial [Myxococcota bacterium]
AERDRLVATIQREVERGATLTAEHREGLERALSHGEVALKVLEVRRDELTTVRERARLARSKVVEHLRRHEMRGAVAQRVDLSA